MLVGQEVWYITRGNIPCRKAITVIYKVTYQNGRELVAFLEQGYLPDKFMRNTTIQELQNTVYLPSLEVTPSQFKDVLTKRKNLFGE